MSEVIFKCASKPKYELIISNNRPNRVGIRSVGSVGTAWYSKNLVLKTILKARDDIDFYTEVLNIFKD